MEKRAFSITKAFKTGLQLTTQHLVQSVLSTLLLWISSFATGIAGLILFPFILIISLFTLIFAPFVFTGALIGLVVFARSLYAGYLRMMLTVTRTHTFDHYTIFKSFSYGLQYVLLDFFYFLPVLLGSVFFLVPGLLLAGRLRFAYFFLIDKDMHVFKALSASWNVTRSNTLKLTLYSALIAGLYLVGTATVIGNLFIYPLVTFTNIYLYRIFISEISE